MDIEIREYRPEDEAQWMRTHAIIMSISHAWNYTIQQRPMYKRPSTCLVAMADGALIGLTDIEYDTEPGELCFLKDSCGGYVLEFGRLPEYAGHQLGAKLIAASVEASKEKGIRRLEYWTQDRNAARFYQRFGLKEIGRHCRFRMKPTEEIENILDKKYIGIEYLYACCLVEEFPLIKQKYTVLEDHPLEPHVCIGYEIRF
ncbi:MAG: GNAT family N-acetyltransferase [Candidatus Hydrogenedentales bacterium]